jgi:ElaB/YqjD/DUF883 family membrane-anchored ribosome-binding protein
MEESLNERLVANFKAVVQNAQALLSSSAGQAGEKFAIARRKFEDSLSDAKAALDKAQGAVKDKTQDAATAADRYVRENPWESVGIAVCVGLLVGLLISRR